MEERGGMMEKEGEGGGWRGKEWEGEGRRKRGENDGEEGE